MTPNELTLILTAGDILIDILAPAPDMTPELKAQFRAKLQEQADLGEAWLEAEIQKLKGQ